MDATMDAAVSRIRGLEAALREIATPEPDYTGAASQCGDDDRHLANCALSQANKAKEIARKALAGIERDEEAARQHAPTSLETILNDAIDGTAWVIVDRPGLRPFTVKAKFSEEVNPLEFLWFDTRADAQAIIVLLDLGPRAVPANLYRYSRRLAP